MYHCFYGCNKRRSVETPGRYPLAWKNHSQQRLKAYIWRHPLTSDPIQGTITLFHALIVFLRSQRPVWLKILRSFWICCWFDCCNTTKAATAPQISGACWAISRCWRCGYTSSSDLINFVADLYAMKQFSYALRDLFGSEFHVVSESIGGLVAATRREPLLHLKETHHTRGGWRLW